MQAAKRQSAAKRFNALANVQERVFWAGLACAALLHAAIILGVARSAPRFVGERDGEPDALSVDIIDAASLAALTSPSREQTEAAAQPSPAREQTEPVPQAESAPSTPAQQQHVPSPWVLDKDAFAAFPTPSAPSEGSAKPRSEPQQHARSSLQLNPPENMPNLGGGRGAAVGRPPNITRSGENDEFGRGVVRALRRTMPSSEALGRVTVRIFLSETGNIAEIALVRSSGNSQLDQSVVFAAKQASFPIPPVGSTPSDRLFLVTYIYNEGVGSRQ